MQNNLYYQEELKDFLKPYFKSIDDLNAFLSDVFDYENGFVTKRQMLFQIQRFVSLANNIEKIAPFCDGLKILFLKICFESLQSLSNYGNQFYDIFCNCFSNEGQDYILSHFKLAFFEDEYQGIKFEANHNINLSDFLRIIKGIRDQIVHDGENWSMQFFAHDDDSIWLTSMKTKEKMIKSYTYQRTTKEIVEYHFETTLNYERFIFYFVEACVKFVKDYSNNYIK